MTGTNSGAGSTYSFGGQSRFFCEVRVSRCLVFCIVLFQIIVCHFVPCLLAIVLSTSIYVFFLFTSLVSSNFYLGHLCKRFSIFNKNRISYQYARCYSGMSLTTINDAILTGRIMITVEQYQMLYLISFYISLWYTFTSKLSLL